MLGTHPSRTARRDRRSRRWRALSSNRNSAHGHRFCVGLQLLHWVTNQCLNETPFRITLTVILVLTIILMAYHRLQAAKSGERISHKEEGLFFAASLRLTGLVMGLAVLAYLIDPGWMEGATLALPTWLRFSGAIVSVLFFGLMYWTLTNLGKNLTDTVVTRTNATLVTTGPYRFVRHPFYVSTGLLICGVTLLTANWLIGFSGLLCLAMLIARTPKEEQKLIGKFGDQYRTRWRRLADFGPGFD